MAIIIIPSKDIYEINNQKVVDNEVDNIEVGVKNVSVARKYSETVFHDTYSTEKQYEYEVSIDKDLEGDIAKHSDDAVGVFNYVEYNSHKYIDEEILIPRLKDNQFIESLVLGTNSEGNSNITVSIIGHAKTGTVTSQNWTGDINYIGDRYSLTNIKKQPFSYSDGIEGEQQTLQIPTKISMSDRLQTIAGVLGKEASVTLSGGNESRVVATIIEQNGIEYWHLNMMMLCGVRVVKFNSYNTAINNPTTIEIPVSGSLAKTEYTEYIATQIELSILGNTIVLDLQDETVKIGDGQRGYSFSGNELMQAGGIKYLLQFGKGVIYKDSQYAYVPYTSMSGNNPPLNSIVLLGADEETTYEEALVTQYLVDGENVSVLRARSGGIIDSFSYSGNPVSFVLGVGIRYNCKDIIKEWKNGKEVAVIKCGLGEYYAKPYAHAYQNNMIDMQRKRKITDTTCAFTGSLIYPAPDKDLILSATINISKTDYEVRSIILSEDKITFTGQIDLAVTDFPLGHYGMKIEYVGSSISTTNSNVPMTFHIGDEVIPYVKGADGKDKPMSLYQDKISPKVFRVIGKGIIADGEILQQLTLQEIPKV